MFSAIKAKHKSFLSAPPLCLKTGKLPGIKKLRQSGGLREIHDFASPPRGGFAISDDIEFGIKL
jgi:hypothetical protein